MFRASIARLVVAAGVTAALLGGGEQSASAQQPQPPLPQMSYYPYHYFPHSYWPAMSPQYPEAPGQPYMRPPAYMAYPPFKEPGWRYEMWSPQKWYRGSHFWLDQF
ncbi:MAG: hypothetical protein LC104_20240 [Bacteroidales bacterium]|nr:hypothetical protein [Bacteroidales bacterium]